MSRLTSTYLKFAILGLLAILIPFGANATEKISVKEQLANIALKSVLTQNEALVYGDVNRSSITNSTTTDYVIDFENKISKALETKRLLASHNFRYESFQSKLEVDKISILGNTAELVATEYTTLIIPNDLINLGSPEKTFHSQSYIFTFVLADGSWRLNDAQLINTFEPAKLNENSDRIDPSTLMANPITPKDYTTANELARLTTSSLNRQLIIDYARQYGINRNTNYRDFSANGGGGDCTNFASQALYNGKWTMISGFYQLETAWWYNTLTQSYTWINAHKWNTFTRNRPRAVFKAYVSDLVPGDILQADWDKDGIIDHTMIVTKKDNNGTIYLTYHTNNTVDRSFWDLYSASPQANWYALHLLDIYDAYSVFIPAIQISGTATRSPALVPAPISPYPAPNSRSPYPAP